MRQLYIYLFLALVLALLVSSFVEARERKYGGRAGKKSAKKNDVASGLDDDVDDDDDDDAAVHARSKQFAALDEEDDGDDDDDDEINSALDDVVEDDSVGAGGQPQATFSESYTLDADGNKVYTWKNTERTTALWHAISSGDVTTLERMIQQDPDVVHYRAEDGRGALFWAYEFDRAEIINLLLEKGADAEQVDKNGEKPEQLTGRGAQ